MKCHGIFSVHLRNHARPWPNVSIERWHLWYYVGRVFAHPCSRIYNLFPTFHCKITTWDNGSKHNYVGARYDTQSVFMERDSQHFTNMTTNASCALVLNEHIIYLYLLYSWSKQNDYFTNKIKKPAAAYKTVTKFNDFSVAVEYTVKVTK